MASWSDDVIFERKGELMELAMRRLTKEESGCWLVRGGTADLYPRMTMPKDKGEKTIKKHLAHVLFVCYNGPVVGGKVLLRTCSHPGCVNPAHMRVATRQEVAAFREEAGDAGHEKRRGRLNGRAKLTENDIRTIRKSELTNQQLADTYHVDRRAIWGIKNRITWKHVPDEEEA